MKVEVVSSVCAQAIITARIGWYYMCSRDFGISVNGQQVYATYGLIDCLAQPD